MEEIKKSYDVKALGKAIAEDAKKSVLPLAEELVKALALSIYLSSKSWIKESALISKTPIDNMVVSFIDHLDAIVLPQIDKVNIDGQS